MSAAASGGAPRAYGRHVWLIPDGFLPDRSQGDLESHEAVCVLNTGAEDVRLTLTAYFEDREPLRGFTVTVPGERTLHVRLDRIRTPEGEAIPRGVPYALLVESDRPVVVQASRMDTSQTALTLMTTMAWPAG